MAATRRALRSLQDVRFARATIQGRRSELFKKESTPRSVFNIKANRISNAVTRVGRSSVLVLVMKRMRELKKSSQLRKWQWFSGSDTSVLQVCMAAARSVACPLHMIMLMFARKLGRRNRVSVLEGLQKSRSCTIARASEQTGACELVIKSTT